jgi:hypothetical protein
MQKCYLEVSKVESSRFSPEFNLFEKNSKELEKLKNLITKSFESTRPLTSSSGIANLQKKQYPLNIRLRFKKPHLRKMKYCLHDVPPFAEEFVKEVTPKKYLVKGKIDNRKTDDVSRSTTGWKTITEKSVDIKGSSLLTFRDFKYRFNSTFRASTSLSKKSKLLIKTPKKELNEKPLFRVIVNRQKHVRFRKKEIKTLDGEEKVNEKIKKLKEIIKDPLIYGID